MYGVNNLLQPCVYEAELFYCQVKQLNFAWPNKLLSNCILAVNFPTIAVFQTAVYSRSTFVNFKPKHYCTPGESDVSNKNKNRH